MINFSFLSRIKSANKKSDIYFTSDFEQAAVVARTARGSLYTIVSVVINTFVTTLGTVLITRQLTSEDFGLYGMIVVLTGFAGMFVDLGLSEAVVQKPVISREQVSVLFWVNLGGSVLLAIIVASLTPLLVWFYDEPRLAAINLVMSGLFIVSALGLQHRALLRRRMAYVRLGLVESIVPFCSMVIAVLASYAGAGVWALVLIPAVSQLLTSVGMWIACGWIPGLPRFEEGVREMLAFGGRVTGFQFVNYFARNADNVMLGFVWGAGSLGLYSRSYSLMMLPAAKINAPLSNCVIPALSRLVGDVEAYRRFYCVCVRLLATCTTPIVCLMLLLSPELIPLLLGEQWVGAVPVFLLLGPAAIMACTNVAGGWLYLSLGHVGRQFRWSLFQAPLVMLFMCLGVWFGPEGLAFCVSLVLVVLKLPGLAFACQGQSVSVWDYFSNVWYITFSCVFAMMIGFTVPWFFSGGIIGLLSVKVFVYVLCLLLLGALVPAGREHFRIIRGVLKTSFNFEKFS